jgi:hypothetical protein
MGAQDGAIRRRTIIHGAGSAGLQPARMRSPLIAVVLLLIAGCGRAVPPVPEPAQGQPVRAVPALAAQGRAVVVAPGVRLSARVAAQRSQAGDVRTALLSDEGLVLLDLAIPAEPSDAGWYRVDAGLTDARRAAPLLARLARHALGNPAPATTWLDRRRVGHVPMGDRQWFGGDPVLLRRATGAGPDIWLDDWRITGDGLAPWCWTAENALVRVQVVLTQARPLAISASP